MDPSSLIFVAIIAIWAAYLLGHWVRRRDQLVTARSIDRFSEAMRVLERRAQMPAPRPAARTYVVAPVRAPLPAPAVAPSRTSTRTAAVRRRTRLLVALASATALTWVLVAVTALPWWVAAVITLLPALMLARLRSTVRRQRQRADVVRRRALDRSRRQDVRAVAGQVVAARQDRLALAARRAADAVDAASVREPAAAAGQPVVDRGWSPVPVPPPTYTLKPKAPPVVRPVAAVVAAPSFDLDEILERRIASGA